MRLRFANLFKEALKKQLILKGVISEEESNEIFSNIRFDFMRDGYFTELKEAEILTNRLGLAQQMEPYIGKYYSHQYMRTKVLHQGRPPTPPVLHLCQRCFGQPEAHQGGEAVRIRDGDYGRPAALCVQRTQCLVPWDC